MTRLRENKTPAIKRYVKVPSGGYVVFAYGKCLGHVYRIGSSWRVAGLRGTTFGTRDEAASYLYRSKISLDKLPE